MRKHRLTRRPIWSTTVLAVLMLLSACGGGGSEASTTTDAPADEPGTTAASGSSTTMSSDGFMPSGTLTLWQHESHPFAETMDELVAAYEEEYGVSVEIENIPFVDYETRVLTAASAGDAPDLVKISGWVLPDWVDKGILSPVNAEAMGLSPEEVEARFEPGVLEGVSVDGVAYGLPVDSNTSVLFYRRDMFEEVGLDPDSPPQTWEELQEYAEALTIPDGNSFERTGFQWWFDTPIWVYLDLHPLITQLGGQLMTADGVGSLNTPEGIAALEYYAGLVTEAGVASPAFWHDRNAYGLMAEDDNAMLLAGGFAGPIMETLSEGGLTVGDQIGVAPLPQWGDGAQESYSGYTWSWGVSPNSENAETAWHFLSYITDVAAADTILEATGIVTPYAGWADSAAAQGNPAVVAMNDQFPNVDYGPRITRFNEMNDLLSDVTQSIIVGDATAEEAAARFDEELQQIMG